MHCGAEEDPRNAHARPAFRSTHPFVRRILLSRPSSEPHSHPFSRLILAALTVAAFGASISLHQVAAGPGCKNVGRKCQRARQCCSGVCRGKKDKKRCKAHDSGGCRGGQRSTGCGGSVDIDCTSSAASREPAKRRPAMPGSAPPAGAVSAAGRMPTAERYAAPAPPACAVKRAVPASGAPPASVLMPATFRCEFQTRPRSWSARSSSVGRPNSSRPYIQVDLR